MEYIQELGLAKSIGISNFNIKQIQRILDNCKIRPANLQVIFLSFIFGFMVYQLYSIVIKIIFFFQI